MQERAAMCYVCGLAKDKSGVKLCSRSALSLFDRGVQVRTYSCNEGQQLRHCLPVYVMCNTKFPQRKCKIVKQRRTNIPVCEQENNNHRKQDAFSTPHPPACRYKLPRNSVRASAFAYDPGSTTFSYSVCSKCGYKHPLDIFYSGACRM